MPGVAIRVFFFAGFDDELGGLNISPPGLNEQATIQNCGKSAAIVPAERPVSHHQSYAVCLKKPVMNNRPNS